jgi:hypothetical protein
METLMCTMDECLLVQGPEAVSLELWDQVVATRVKVEDSKRRLQVICYLCQCHACLLFLGALCSCYFLIPPEVVIHEHDHCFYNNKPCKS